MATNYIRLKSKDGDSITVKTTADNLSDAIEPLDDIGDFDEIERVDLCDDGGYLIETYGVREM